MSYATSYRSVFGEDLKKETYKYESHNFSGVVGGKHFCTKCGLISLNNEFSQWSIDKGCNSEDHPAYKQKRKLTSFK